MKRLFLVLMFAPFAGIGQNADSGFIKKISDEMLVNGKAYENLRHLTKEIGGRLAGSRQMVMAEQWGLSALKEAGADTVFLQECMVPHWVRGGQDKAAIVSVGANKKSWPLEVLALGNSLGSGKKGVTAPVLAVASFDELEKRKDEVKGKIVFYNYGFNPAYVYPGQSYGEAGLYRYAGASRAAKYGAVGVMIRSLSGSTDNSAHTGMMRYNDSFPKIPAVALGLIDANRLWSTCKENRNVTVSMTTNGQFLPDTVGHNVIAELKGTDAGNEFITVGGHLDSWDVNEGAHDDGTGIVQTIEILRTLKALGYKPKHTIRYVLFANEENGLAGGKKYAEAAKANNEKHVFALETDGGGFTPRGFTFELSDAALTKIQPWTQLLKPYGVFELTTGGGGADISALYKTLKTPVAEFRPDGQRYFDIHHAKTDVFEAVNKRELLLGAVNMAGLIFLVDKYGL